MRLIRLFLSLSLLSTLLLAQATLPTAQVTGGKVPQLPPPFATPAAENGPHVVAAPEGFVPTVPAGFHVSVFARDFKEPRWLAVAPNGDIFVTDSSAGELVVLRDPQHKGVSTDREIFADHLALPFGIAFHDNYVYVAESAAVVRFPFDPKTSKRTGDKQQILDLPGGGYHQHWTRTIVFSRDGRHLYTAVGSQGNVDIETDQRRAAVIVSDPDGKNSHNYASGLRNSVGLDFDPVSGELWSAVNERDNLGDDLPSDYFTHLTAGGFYGWPYSYLGNHADPRITPQRPDLVAKAIVPDVLLGTHVAPLQFTFHIPDGFPAAYRRGAFIAEHGSWNRHQRDGYQVVFVPFHGNQPAGAPRPFFGGFVPDPSKREVYGRPVGLVASDGALLISDDGGKLIWRVSYGHR